MASLRVGCSSNKACLQLYYCCSRAFANRPRTEFFECVNEAQGIAVERLGRVVAAAQFLASGQCKILVAEKG